MTTTNRSPSSTATLTAQDELVITRVFDAPRHLVWKAWTEPEGIARWWGPQHFTAPVCQIDLRVGGTYLFCMRSPDGLDFWSTGVYREILEPERLVYTDNFADADGNVVPASYYGMGDDWPVTMQTTVTFEEHDGKTTLTLRQAGVPAGQMSELTRAGWNGSLDKLAASLSPTNGEQTMIKSTLTAEPGQQEIRITRLIDAPRDLVFKTITDPALIPQWWGPHRLTTTVDQMDLRPGGIWRYINSGADGTAHGFHGVYHAIEAPERLVYTFEYEGMPGHVLLETVTFEEVAGKTRMTDSSVFQTVADRDGMLASGMEEGASESMDRFAALLAQAQR